MGIESDDRDKTRVFDHPRSARLALATGRLTPDRKIGKLEPGGTQNNGDHAVFGAQFALIFVNVGEGNGTSNGGAKEGKSLNNVTNSNIWQQIQANGQLRTTRGSITDSALRQMGR